MSKLSDVLAKALAKKQGKTQVDANDTSFTESQVKKVKATPGSKKPLTRSAGRGR